MRSEVLESKLKTRAVRIRRDDSRTPMALEPTAVDAALADESLSILIEPGSRRDPAESPFTGTKAREATDRALLASLAEQLDLLHQQQQQIRMLLDRAGRTRVDGPNA